MTVDHRQSHLESIRSALSVLIYPVQYVVNLPVEASRWASDTLVTHSTLVHENERLRKSQLLLSSRLQKFQILESENERLRRLLESSFKLSDRVLIAELLAADLQPFRHTIVINKGKRQGVYDGQPIVDANGVMGQVVHVGPFSSTVLLITDPTHELPVQINRNGLRAIAIGTGQGNNRASAAVSLPATRWVSLPISHMILQNPLPRSMFDPVRNCDKAGRYCSSGPMIILPRMRTLTVWR